LSAQSRKAICISSKTPMLDVGTRLGSLEITALLGKGGMGEVYRARDTKLKRDVAVKFCPMSSHVMQIG
jgi:serine/threonine protein kinase